MDSHWPKLWSRLSVQTPVGGLGDTAGSFPLCFNLEPLPSGSNTGRVCLGGNSTVGPVYDLVPRSTFGSDGCPSVTVGRSDLFVPSSSTLEQSPPESEEGANPCDPRSPSVAFQSMVVPNAGNDDGTTPSSSSLQLLHNSNDGTSTAVPGPSGRSVHFREELGRSLAAHDLDDADLEFLTGHLADQSASGYSYAFEKFKRFCSNFNVDPYTCPPSYLVKFLRTKFDSGASYSTICFYRSAVSKFHAGIGSQPLGQHHLINKAVRAAFRLRPPLPKYKKTYDISPVLAFIANLQPLEKLSLKMLTLKCFFLLSFSSLSRVSSVARLRKDVEETQVCTATI